MPKSLAELLPHGSIQKIADKLGIGKQAVSKALRRQRPGHPAVLEALQMAKASGAFEAARDLALVLTPTA
jgi:predicted transcriptional regulator